MWTNRDKTSATAIAAAPAVARLAMLVLSPFGLDLVSGWVGLVAFAFVGLAPAAAGITLVFRLNARRL